MATAEKEHCTDHSGCSTDIINLKQSDRDQWDAINKIQNRPPVWATLVISLLTFALGFTLSFAAMKQTMANDYQKMIDKLADRITATSK